MKKKKKNNNNTINNNNNYYNNNNTINNHRSLDPKESLIYPLTLREREGKQDGCIV